MRRVGIPIVALCLFLGCGQFSPSFANESKAPVDLTNLEKLMGAPATGAVAPPDDSTKVEENNPTKVEENNTSSQSETTEAASTASGNTPSEAVPNETAMVIAKPATPPATAKPSGPPLSQMAQVKLNYKEGKFRQALDVIAKMKPTDTTHYYAGLCYQGQGQLRQAFAEFQWAASYAKDPLIKYNASMAMQTVSSYARARTYGGQGNNFARTRTGAYSGGGGGFVRRG